MSASSTAPESLEGLDDAGPDGGAGVEAPWRSDPLRRRKDHCLDRLAGIARREARTAAEKVQVIAEFLEVSTALADPTASPQDLTAQEMALVAEIACALTVSERTASTLIAESRELISALPLTLSALQAGMISWQHARYIVDETTNLDPAAVKALEAHFLDPDAPNPARGGPAGELVPSRFRHKVRIWRERHHPVSIEKRHIKSVADRCLQYTPERDGMAWFSAYLPADQAAGIWERTTAAARALQGPDEGRTLTQLRVDTVATWLLGGSAGNLADGVPPSPRAQVLVTVPVMSLLGVTDEPADLDGYGPMPVTMARRLIADGDDSFHRVLIDPRDGAPLEIGRKSYRVTKAQRRWLRLRDGKCPFPGCSNASLDNEADHLVAWAHGGTTGISNLAQPCAKHHRLRRTTGWTPEPATKDEPPGWISPTGRRYASEHPDWEPPRLPDERAHHAFQTSEARIFSQAASKEARTTIPNRHQPEPSRTGKRGGAVGQRKEAPQPPRLRRLRLYVGSICTGALCTACVSRVSCLDPVTPPAGQPPGSITEAGKPVRRRRPYGL